MKHFINDGGVLAEEVLVNGDILVAEGSEEELDFLDTEGSRKISGDQTARYADLPEVQFEYGHVRMVTWGRFGVSPEEVIFYTIVCWIERGRNCDE